MIVFLLSLLAACAPEGTTPAAHAVAAPAALRTARAEPVAWTPSVELTGTLAPIASVYLGFDVPGRIERLLVQRGARVAPSQPVARLDASIAEAQLAQAEAAVAGAKAQLRGAEAAFARLTTLRGAGGVSEQQDGDAEAGVEAGRAGVQQAEAAALLARTHVANHTLRSPIGGVVTNSPDNVGAMTGAGTPVFVIEDLSALLLKATAPESAGWLQADMSAEVLLPGGAVIPATVTRVIPSLDPQTRRIPVEVRVDAPPPTLRANAFARVRVTGAANVDAWKVAEAAVVARPDYRVYVVGPEGRPTAVSVEVLERADGAVVVRAALTDGAELVLNPPAELEG